MADNNMKITDAGTITSMNGTDKVFVNSGDDLKQITLDNAVANSTPVKTLSSNLGSIRSLEHISYTEVGSNTSDEDFCKKFLIKVCKTPRVPCAPYIGSVNPNSYGVIFGSIYNTGDKDSNGIPKYSYFLLLSFGKIAYFGTTNYEFFFTYIHK